ncbi:MAG: UDP-N-acetylmuramoylalanine--D-glutamate ligase [Candidatus Fraserbacteria bacterium RBG_16_55_9]|uniref:UDP-N-acetylmuramoylalanine--D-glutamate ligase n=1 Tax=Fraserbacteria sp. (strain RBG_16_55_9) TaxID=1817864 RepID=A0A1F5UPR0_FRAXR|nr:MAG: UDP-N-acetylmuramoylalanine--D-glutamate ligase [Candidatus Fraserbacteria bacterium RBG_16_55_9]
MPNDLAGARVTVLGAGRTGQATARFLSRQHAVTFVSDRAQIPSSVQHELANLSISCEEGGHSERALQADLIIPSPGIPCDVPVLMKARAQGIPILSELELAYRFIESEKIIAVTGTVGKTTTTHLVAELLKSYGHPTVVAGNIGQPLIALLGKINKETAVVLEVSSYQLEHVDTFRPHIGVFTRFAPHHLDRHGSLECYFAIKCRLFAKQTERDFALVQRDIALPHPIRSRVLKYSAKDLETLQPNLHRHQREDLAGALQAARLLDPAITHERLDLARALWLPHRLEFVAEVNGVCFYNDSKATSSAATRAALESFPEPLVLILGGYDEGDNLKELAVAIQERNVQAVLLMGQTRERWALELKSLGYRSFRIVTDVGQAIEEALKLRPHACLFSPASPSFDQFRNYEERGEHFKHIVCSYLPQTAITLRSDQLAAAP